MYAMTRYQKGDYVANQGIIRVLIDNSISQMVSWAGSKPCLRLPSRLIKAYLQTLGRQKAQPNLFFLTKNEYLLDFRRLN